MKTIFKLCILLFMLSCNKGDMSSQDESTGYNMLLIGNSFFKPYADHLSNLATEANLNKHSSIVVKRGGELGRPINFWNDSTSEEHQLIKSTLDQGNIEVFGMASGYTILVKAYTTPATRFRTPAEPDKRVKIYMIM